jgi:hypothetical protein
MIRIVSRSCLRFRLELAVVGFLSALCLSAIAVGCSSSSSSSSSTPSSSSTGPTAAAGSTPNWHSFSITKQDTTLSSVDEMQATGGFKFIFPSYLPAGAGTTMAVAAAPATTGDTPYGAAEEIMILSATADGPTIMVHEQKAPLPQTYVDIATDEKAVQSIVAKYQVWCLPEDLSNGSGTNPGLKCIYVTVDRAFAFLFQWQVESPVEGLVSDAQQQESMKVIASTIQAPASW